MRLSESFFEGRKLLIKLGNDHKDTPGALTPRPERVNPMLKRQQHKASATLFVGNLSFEATETALRDFVEVSAASVSASVKEEAAGALEKGAETDGEAEIVDLDKGRGGKNSGLRKVRMGTFEDTGRSKG